MCVKYVRLHKTPNVRYIVYQLNLFWMQFSWNFAHHTNILSFLSLAKLAVFLMKNQPGVHVSPVLVLAMKTQPLTKSTNTIIVLFTQ